MKYKIEIMLIMYCYAFLNGFMGAKNPVKERLVSAVIILFSFGLSWAINSYRNWKIAKPFKKKESEYTGYIVSRLNRISRDAHILQVGMVKSGYRPDNTLKLIWERACLEVALSQMPFSSHQSVVIYREWIEILVKSEEILKAKFKFYLPRNKQAIKNSLAEKISFYVRQFYHAPENERPLVISKVFADRCQHVVGVIDPSVQAMSLRITKESLDYWGCAFREVGMENEDSVEAMSSYDAA